MADGVGRLVFSRSVSSCSPSSLFPAAAQHAPYTGRQQLFSWPECPSASSVSLSPLRKHADDSPIFTSGCQDGVTESLPSCFSNFKPHTYPIQSFALVPLRVKVLISLYQALEAAHEYFNRKAAFPLAGLRDPAGVCMELWVSVLSMFGMIRLWLEPWPPEHHQTGRKRCCHTCHNDVTTFSLALRP